MPSESSPAVRSKRGNGSWTPEQRARLSASMKRARRKAGKSWYKRKTRMRAAVERPAMPVHVYALAKNLRKATARYVMDCHGEVDDLALSAFALTRVLLGE